jgi:hypothetical protein
LCRGKNVDNQGPRGAFASRSRAARLHQPADAGRSPGHSWAFPVPASSRTGTTWPRRLFVGRTDWSRASGLTRACGCVGRQPGERGTSVPRWKRRQQIPGSHPTRGLRLCRGKNVDNQGPRGAFASRSRAARLHQPADAGRSPGNSWAFPVPASSRTGTTWPRRLFVGRTDWSRASGLTRACGCSGRQPGERGTSVPRWKRRQQIPGSHPTRTCGCSGEKTWKIRACGGCLRVVRARHGYTSQLTLAVRRATAGRSPYRPAPAQERPGLGGCSSVERIGRVPRD